MFFVNANLQATEKVSFFAEGVYSLSKGSFASITGVAPEGIDATVPISPDNPASTADYDFSSVNEYSDLDYSQLEATLGVNYKLDERASLYGAVNLMDLEDDQAYVYGDLSGTITTYSAGMSVGF